MRAGIAIVFVALAACGAGSGEGLDQNGRPPAAGGGGFVLPPVVGLAPTFDSIQNNVLTVTCAVPGCHGGGGAQQGLRLDAGFAYGNLVNVASPRDASLIRVVPGDADASFIIQKLEGIKTLDGTQILGDRMPDGGPYLPQSTIDVIRLWIANGALQ